MVLPDFEEADFPNYGPVPLNSWSPPYLNEQGDGQTDIGVVSWVMSGGGGSNQIYGYYITDEMGLIRAAERNVNGPTTVDVDHPNYSVYVSWRLGRFCAEE